MCIKQRHVIALALLVGSTAVPFAEISYCADRVTNLQAGKTEIEGAWARTGVVVGALRLDDGYFAGQVLEIQADKFALRGGSGDWAGTLKVDPRKAPKTIDFTMTGGRGAGETWRGIYTLDKDGLRIYYTTGTDKPRPTTIPTTKFLNDIKYTLATFSRVR